MSFYQRLNSKMCEHDDVRELLCLLDRLLVLLCAASYPALLVILMIARSDRFLPSLLIPAISFFLISLLRIIVDRKRPYERENICEILGQKTSGRSFPSRHVFSAAIIAATFAQISPIAAIILFVCAVSLAAIRVLGCVHYISDVVAGLALGSFFGILYLFF